MNFTDLLSRADASLLQELIGAEVVRLLHALDERRATPMHLRAVLLELHSPAELLLDKKSRPRLLEMLRESEAISLLDFLVVERVGNPFRQLAALEAKKGTKLADLLLAYFHVRLPEKESEPPAESQAVRGGYELFPHQRAAALEAGKMLAKSPHRVLLHMPTGSGKTRTAMSLIANHLRDNEDSLVLWLAAAEELCEQAADEFANAWRNVGNRLMPVHRWWGDHSMEGRPPSDGFAVAGLAKMYSRAIADPPWLAFLGDSTSLVVFDEAHQAVAPTYRHVVESVLARRPQTGLLGLSATPGRTWNDINADEQLAEVFAKRKVTLRIRGYENPIDYLVDEHYLARPKYRQIECHGPELSAYERSQLGAQLDIPPSVLRKLADDHLRNLHIASEVQSLARRHRRIIVFSTTVAHAEMLAVVMRAQGIATRAVTASTPREERAAAIRWYRQDTAGETRVLTNYGVLTTGFDAPRTSAALIARPTKSLVLYSQMVGRAIRGTRAGGNLEAEIVTVIDTELPGFRNVTEAFTNWEDVWVQ